MGVKNSSKKFKKSGGTKTIGVTRKKISKKLKKSEVKNKSGVK